MDKVGWLFFTLVLWVCCNAQSLNASTCKVNPSLCTDDQLCTAATNWDPQTDLHSWDQKYPNHINEAQQQGKTCKVLEKCQGRTPWSNCYAMATLNERDKEYSMIYTYGKKGDLIKKFTTQTKITCCWELDRSFRSLSKAEQKYIQTKLSEGGYYKSSIDGQYGPDTRRALIAYNKDNFSNARLGIKSNTKRLFKNLLHNKQPKFTSASTESHPSSLLEETSQVREPKVPKRLNFTEVEALFKAKEYGETFKQVQPLAINGEPKAQLLLGKLFADGLGTIQINTTAHMWFNIASMAGSDEAYEERKKISISMTPAALEKAQDMALKCIQSDFRDCGLITIEHQKKYSDMERNNIEGSFKAETALRRKQLQYALRELGVYSKSIDGKWGKGTASAFANFQQIQGSSFKKSDTLFNSILSKVSVPTSFRKETKQINKTTHQGSIKKFKNALGFMSYGNPSVSVAQAMDICKNKGANAFDAASNAARFQSNSYSANCYGNSYSANCRMRQNSPYGNSLGEGLAIGLMEGITRGMAGKAAREREMKACMAHYGWRKK